VDMSETGRDPVHDFETIMTELASFNEDLPRKPMLVVASKVDAAQEPARIAQLREMAREKQLGFFEISSATGQGIEELKYAMAERVTLPHAAPKVASVTDSDPVPAP
ncbi:MAG: GTPase ObgE, partial [Acidobacteriota bacterium]|nr:GTPase ObgE [Acidobacteriota bacterium]